MRALRLRPREERVGGGQGGRDGRRDPLRRAFVYRIFKKTGDDDKIAIARASRVRRVRRVPRE